MGCEGSKEVDDSNSPRESPSWRPEDLAASQIVFVLGGPGCGKGTICSQLKAEFGFTHLSTGDIFRAEVSTGSERGKHLQEIMESGALVSLELTMEVVCSAVRRVVSESVAKGNGEAKVLLDGFPREISQAVEFEKQMGRSCTFVLSCEANFEVMKERILMRGKTSGRADDNEESLLKRFETYNATAQPLVEHFEKEGLLKKVDCSGSVEETYANAKRHFVS